MPPSRVLPWLSRCNQIYLCWRAAAFILQLPVCASQDHKTGSEQQMIVLFGGHWSQKHLFWKFTSHRRVDSWSWGQKKLMLENVFLFSFPLIGPRFLQIFPYFFFLHFSFPPIYICQNQKSKIPGSESTINSRTIWSCLQNLRQEAAGGLKRWRRGRGRSNYAALWAAGVLSVKLRAAKKILIVKFRAAGVLSCEPPKTMIYLESWVSRWSFLSILNQEEQEIILVKRCWNFQAMNFSYFKLHISSKSYDNTNNTLFEEQQDRKWTSCKRSEIWWKMSNNTFWCINWEQKERCPAR